MRFARLLEKSGICTRYSRKGPELLAIFLLVLMAKELRSTVGNVWWWVR